MFGKGLIRIIGLIIAGAIALAAGAELLTSVVSVVLSFRSGNPLPLAGVVLITIVLLRLVQRQKDDTPIKMVLNIASYAVSGYLAVVAFVIALPFGLFASVGASVAAVVFCSLLGDPSSILEQVKVWFPDATTGTKLVGLSKRTVPIGDGGTFALNGIHTIVLVDKSEKEKILELMKTRPRLPISLTHYEDTDVLFITTRDQSMVERVVTLLKDSEIRNTSTPSQILSEVIQMIPILDANHGLSSESYRLAKEEQTVSDLVKTWSVRTTAFPSDSGIRLLVPDHASTGLNVERLEEGRESEILLTRNFQTMREVDEKLESPT